MSSKIDKSKISILSDVIKRDFDAGLIPGASVMVIKDGEEVYFDAIGYADMEQGKKMERDTYFRMYSQTKPYTGFASAMCVDRGLFTIREPVYNYFPTFANKQSYINGELRAAPRPVYISDLLNMTSGISYPGDYDETSRITLKLFEEIRAAQDRGERITTKDIVSRVGEIPTAFAPGDRWAYGFSADVMGGVIGEANGCTYGEFLKKEIFDPLGMTTIGFSIPEKDREKLAKTYLLTKDGLKPYGEVSNDLDNRNLGLNSYKEGYVDFESGGAGLVGTIDSLVKFSKMLVARGKVGDDRIISKYGFDWYTSPQLTKHQARSFDWQDCLNHNYGNFLNIKSGNGVSSTPDNVGSFGWGGWLGTNCFVDPVENMSMIFLIQRQHDGSLEAKNTQLYYRMRSALYTALV